jgi:sec-independent protein translocase protein TatA
MPFMNIHPAFLIVLLIIVLIIFGPGKLPELGGAAGRMMREFRKTSSEITDELKSSVAEKEPGQEAPKEPVATPPVATAEAKKDAEKSA